MQEDTHEKECCGGMKIVTRTLVLLSPQGELLSNKEPSR